VSRPDPSGALQTDAEHPTRNRKLWNPRPCLTTSWLRPSSGTVLSRLLPVCCPPGSPKTAPARRERPARPGDQDFRGEEVRGFEPLASSLRARSVPGIPARNCVVLRTRKMHEKRQVSGRRRQDRMSGCTTVFGQAPRSLRTPVAASLLPDGADPPSKPRGWARSSWMLISTAAAAQGPLDRAHASVAPGPHRRGWRATRGARSFSPGCRRTPAGQCCQVIGTRGSGV
jgi:hypothetical protein